MGTHFAATRTAHATEMLVRRNVSRSEDQMVLPTTCPSARRSATTAWPIILLAVVACGLFVTASGRFPTGAPSQPEREDAELTPVETAVPLRPAAAAAKAAVQR